MRLPVADRTSTSRHSTVSTREPAPPVVIVRMLPVPLETWRSSQNAAMKPFGVAMVGIAALLNAVDAVDDVLLAKSCRRPLVLTL